MITLAPWVIHLLYAESFSPAAEILRWQVLGDIFKVASAPIVFIFLATGHGGIAVGLERIAALMAGEPSIRDVIAFPKTTTAQCPLTDAPSAISDAQLEELHIGVKTRSE